VGTPQNQGFFSGTSLLQQNYTSDEFRANRIQFWLTFRACHKNAWYAYLSTGPAECLSLGKPSNRSQHPTTTTMVGPPTHAFGCSHSLKCYMPVFFDLFIGMEPLWSI